jgi:hypothetical protein
MVVVIQIVGAVQIGNIEIHVAVVVVWGAERFFIAVHGENRMPAMTGDKDLR